MRVLFVCSGNICRSPMAEAIFNHLADRAGRSDLHAVSAGTLGIVGRPAAEEAILSLAERHIDLRDHRSSALDATAMASADVVVAMESAHLEFIDRRFPEAGVPRFLVRAFSQGPEPALDPSDLPDPIGQPLQLFREQREELTPTLEALLAFLTGGGIG